MLGHNNLQLFPKACILVRKYFSLPVNKAQYSLKEILYQQIQLFKLYYANKFSQ